VEFKLAKNELQGKSKKISVKTMEEEVTGSGKIYYFDKDNTHKEMMALVEHFENRGNSIYFKEVKFSLDEGDYLYEVHII
jgi:hypothetical protein